MWNPTIEFLNNRSVSIKAHGKEVSQLFKAPHRDEHTSHLGAHSRTAQQELIGLGFRFRV